MMEDVRRTKNKTDNDMLTKDILMRGYRSRSSCARTNEIETPKIGFSTQINDVDSGRILEHSKLPARKKLLAMEVEGLRESGMGSCGSPCRPRGAADAHPVSKSKSSFGNIVCAILMTSRVLKRRRTMNIAKRMLSVASAAFKPEIC